MANIKTRVLELLESDREKSFSGEELARSLLVSRTAVWKSVGELRREGFAIEAVTNRGYRLLPESGVLSVQGILSHLRASAMEERIHLLPEARSTNLSAKQMALEGAPHGTVVLTDHQTEGRGRRGRVFFSPPGKGLYLTMLLRPPSLELEHAGLYTVAAAVAVCRAVRNVTGLELEIKWVNDLLLEGKKACGILTEAINDLESGGVECLVVGVGINVTTLPEEFPPELDDTAISLAPGSGEGSLRTRLAAALIDQLLEMEPDSGCLEEYRRRCPLLGKRVTVVPVKGSPFRATAEDIDQRGRLKVRRGYEVLHLLSGEVSVLPE